MRYTLIRSLMFIKLTACVMGISAVLHGTTVAFQCSISQPGHSPCESRCKYMVEVITKDLTSCRSVPVGPPALEQAGTIFCQRELMTIQGFAQCCKLVDRYSIRYFFMRASGNVLYQDIRNLCSATGEKICSMNLDHEITFHTLYPRALPRNNLPEISISSQISPTLFGKYWQI